MRLRKLWMQLKKLWELIMLRVRTEIDVRNVSPNKLYSWLLDVDDERYRAWHPAHRGYQRVLENPEIVGSVVKFEEHIGGRRLGLAWEITQAKLGESLGFKAKFPYPVNLSLGFTPIEVGTRVQHDLRIGFGGLVGNGIDLFVGNMIFTRSLARAVSSHAIQEFRNLESILG